MDVSTRETKGAALSEYVQMVWERRRLIVIVIGVTTALALATRPPAPVALYRATTTVQIRPFQFSTSGQSTTSSFSQGVPPSEIQAARSPEVAAKTAEELHLGDGGVDLLQRLGVTSPEGTDLLQLELIGRGLATVAELKAYAENYVEIRNQQNKERIERALASIDDSIKAIEPRVHSLSQQIAAEDARGEVSAQTRTQYDAVSLIFTQFIGLRERIQLDSALAGDEVQLLGSPIIQRLGAIPTRTLRTLAGPFVGLLLGAALAIAMGVLRPRISSRERTEERLGYPILATIPLVRPAASVQRDPLVIQRGSVWGAEGMRMLLTELDLLERDGRKLRVVVVASPEPRDGRSTVAANIAASYAAAGRSVALLRADGELSQGSGHGPKSAQFIGGSHEIVQVRMHRESFAEIIPGPARPRTVSEPRTGRGLSGVVEDLARNFDTVVVDTRPVMNSADAVSLARTADVVVMVLRQFATHEVKAMAALEVLARHEAPVGGLVMNGSRVSMLERYRGRRPSTADQDSIAHEPQRARPEAKPTRAPAGDGPAEAALRRQPEPRPAIPSVPPARPDEPSSVRPEEPRPVDEAQVASQQTTAPTIP